MVAGREGLGKSTFINTLLEEEVVAKPLFIPPEQSHLERQVTIDTYHAGTVPLLICRKRILWKSRQYYVFGCS